MDYHETFAPVAKTDSIHLVFAISASKQCEVHHMDVKSAFIHGYIHEEIYMKQPEGYITDPYLVCKLEVIIRVKTCPNRVVFQDGYLPSLGKVPKV